MHPNKLLPYEAACLILEAYIAYYSKYKRITKHAQIRYEEKDWAGIQEDAGARITLYRDMVGETTEKLLTFLGERAMDRKMWLLTKIHFSEEIANFNTRNIAESFYNSVFRHAHRGQLGKDDELMFVHGRGNYREFRSMVPIYHTLYLTGSFELTVSHLLEYYPFDIPYEDRQRDIGYIVRRLREWAYEYAAPGFPVHLEVLKSVFFRNKAAYIVGRLVQHGDPVPFVLCLLNGDSGLVIDTLLLEENEVSTIFSFNRSYFLVDVDIVTETVDFLRSIMPAKSMGELYNSIGFEKHGKTVFYRDFERHLQLTIDDFVFTKGSRAWS
ncbi:MAG: isocitrate dehydrogenase kinase/phosphatase AceK regulatory subunit [Saprospiraceae bacterium]